jgi:ribosomal protein S18 acetylase RimI-like enzyme
MVDTWEVRMARPDDHDAIIEVVDEWWGRPVAAGVPRLFLDHFYTSSLVAETSGELAGFLIGFVSPSRPDEAYIHFAGVRPDLQRAGLGRELYERFIAGAVELDRTVIRAITSPSNHESIEFHRRLGFEVFGPVPDYNRPGLAHVRFELIVPDAATR